MTIYELIFDREFKKDLSKLDKEMRNRILKKVFELEKYPELGKHLIGIVNLEFKNWKIQSALQNKAQAIAGARSNSRA